MHSDGWKEQGFETTHGGSKVITFSVPFIKLVHGASLVYKGASNSYGTAITWHSLNSLTLTSVSIKNSDETTFTRRCSFWGY